MLFSGLFLLLFQTELLILARIETFALEMSKVSCETHCGSDF